MKSYDDAKLLVCLKSLLLNGPVCSGSGICQNLFVLYDKTHNELIHIAHLQPLMSQWPHFSGNPDFPVPNPWKSGNPEQAYLDATDHQMWSPVNAYGRLRWRLLRFMIKTLEAQLSRDK